MIWLYKNIRTIRYFALLFIISYVTTSLATNTVSSGADTQLQSSSQIGDNQPSVAIKNSSINKVENSAETQQTKSQTSISKDENAKISTTTVSAGDILTSKKSAESRTTDEEDADVDMLRKSLLKNGFEELVVQLSINYEESEVVSTVLRNSKNDILVPMVDLIGFKVNDQYLLTGVATINNAKYINLSKLPDTEYKMDDEKLILAIDFPAKAMPVQDANVWRNTHRYLNYSSMSGTPIKSGFLNYDLTFNHSSDNKVSAAGVQEFNYSHPKGVGTQTVFTKYNFYGAKQLTLVRLDTSWTSEQDHSIAQYKIGDSITKAADWSGSTRFAGFQYATDFALDPNFVTYPLVNFQGRADLPTTLDIYNNSQLVYRTELKTGNFNMQDLPVSAGKGTLEVKQQDITGKIQTIYIPYYIVPNLLKKGLVSYSANIGTQRLLYGSESNKYKYMITNFHYNKGITDYWTSGIHFESLRDNFSVGLSNLLKVGRIGVVSFSGATSGPNLKNAQKLVTGYSFQGGNINGGAQYTYTSSNFINTFTKMSETTRHLFRGYGSYLLTKKSSIGASYLRAVNIASQGDRSVNGSMSLDYQNNIRKNITLRCSMGQDLKQKNRFVSISLGINIGGNYISSSVYKQGKETTTQAGITSNSKDGKWFGYRANFTHNTKTFYDIQLDKSFSKIDTAFYLFNDGGSNTTQQITVQGALVQTSDGMFATKSINNSFAVVKTAEFKDVDIYYNNHYITKTNKNGVAFIPNVIPNAPSQIRLDEQTLPLNAEFADTFMVIAPDDKSGVKAEFAVKKVRAANIVLLDHENKPVTRDAEVKVDGLEDDLFVGYDGKVYISDLKDLKELNGSACIDDDCCHFHKSLEGMQNFDLLDLGAEKCVKD